MDLVVVGCGVAGVTTARSVAERDPSIGITIYSSEPYPYYPRPRLIELLAGRATPEEMPQYSPEWYEERGIRTELGRTVVQIDPAEHSIQLGDGTAVGYDVLVLATGARPWIPPIPGRDLAGVQVLRTMDDALMLRDRVQTSECAVVLGGGLLGLDMSAALCARGEACGSATKVFTLEAFDWLLPRQLDQEGAACLQKRMGEMGVEVITGDLCTLIEGDQQVERVHLKSGRVIETDTVVVSTGIRSNTQLAAEAGLTCNHGVVVDDRLRSGHPDVLAIGDAAEYNERVWGIIPAAVAQARVAAAQIVGDDATRYVDIVPTTTLKVSGVDLLSIGTVHKAEDDGLDEIRHTDAESGVYKKLSIECTAEGSYVVGAIVLGDPDDMRAAARLVNQRIDIGPWLAQRIRSSVSSDEGLDLQGMIGSLRKGGR